MRQERRILKTDLLSIKIHDDEHPAIVAMQQLLINVEDQLNQQEQLALIRCFLDHPVEVDDVNYKVIMEILTLFMGDVPYRSENAFSTLVDLNKADVLNDENLAAYLAHKNPESLAIAFCNPLENRTLGNKYSNLVTAKIVFDILNCENPIELTEAFETLAHAELLDSELLYKVLHTDEKDSLIKHQDPKSLAEAICSLHKSSLLNSENLERIIPCDAPFWHSDRAAMVVRALSKTGILTIENWNKILTWEPVYRKSLSSGILCLSRMKDLLTQKSFDQLLSPELVILANPNIYELIWQRISYKDFTSKNLEEMFDIARAYPDPLMHKFGLAMITEYLNNALGSNKNNKQEIEAARCEMNNAFEIRRIARLLALESRTVGSLFESLPDEVNIGIAARTADPAFLNEMDALDIATKYFDPK